MKVGLPWMTKYPSCQWMASCAAAFGRKDFVRVALSRGPNCVREKKNGSEEKGAVYHGGGEVALPE